LLATCAVFNSNSFVYLDKILVIQSLGELKKLIGTNRQSRDNLSIGSILPGVYNLEYNEYKVIKIPHRRNSLFSLLHHTNNGFHKNKWKNQVTRWNQLRFFNEVVPNNLIENDGLSNLEFIEYGKRIIENNILHVNIGI
jgi:hypothetical protein